MSDDPTRAANRAVFLAALHPEPETFARLVERHAGELDWNGLLEHAAAHKVSALLAHRVATAGSAASMPGDARERLREAGKRAGDRNAKALIDLAAVDRCLRGAGIAYLLVKGPILTQQVYEDPSQRSFFDLDLVVHQVDVDAAQAALEGLGYRLWGGDRYLGFAPEGGADLARATRLMRRSMKSFGHELALVIDDRSRLPIDLHWNLMPPGRIRARPAEIWENTTTAVVGGIEVRVLDREATLLHLAMHAWSNRPWSFALLHLCDVAWALHRAPVDRERLAELADRWGGRDDLERALFAIEHALGIPVPSSRRTDGGALPGTLRFRRTATPENLVELCRLPAAAWWERWRQELDWGLAVGSLRSTGILLFAKYVALLRYRAGGG